MPFTTGLFLFEREDKAEASFCLVGDTDVATMEAHGMLDKWDKQTRSVFFFYGPIDAG